MDFVVTCLNNIGFGAGLMIGFSAGMFLTNKGPWDVLDKFLQSRRDDRRADKDLADKKTKDHERDKDLADNYTLDDRLVYFHKTSRKSFCYFCMNKGIKTQLPCDRLNDELECQECGKKVLNVFNLK